ncbi:MAG: hypothetical protein H7210_02365 [Pyrinomonadaceae bacterium]|nr:hypothetical protein [Phycisphaerales bacterium]
MNAPTGLVSARLSRNWLAKMGVFLVVLLVFGTWGLVDATVIYPRRGLEDASFKLRNYLQKAVETNRLTPSSIKVENPAETLSKLAARETLQLRSKSLGAVAEPLTDLELARLAWLRSLDRVWKLDVSEVPVCKATRTKRDASGNEIFAGVGGTTEAQKEIHEVSFKVRQGAGLTVGPDGKAREWGPDAVLKDLNAFWGSTKKTPSALEFYDLPSQWVFVVIGFGGGLYVLFLLVRASLHKYQFAPQENRLVLPGGVSILPTDLKDLDKRRWHKFFVTLNLKNGKSYPLDLLRYVPLEEWILKMEKAAFPDAADADGRTGADESSSASENGGPPKPALAKDVGKISNMTYGGVFEGVFAVLLFERPEDHSDADYPGYVQGETLKALGAALAPEGGWQLWLTACRGPLGGRATRVSGGASLGVRNLADWLDGTAFGYLVNASLLDAQTAGRIRAGASGTSQQAVNPYIIGVGRVSDAAAARLHETMLDPTVPGYRGMLIVKVNPATIERISEPLELEAGLEIKGAVCKGQWQAPAIEVEQAGLAVEELPRT